MIALGALAAVAGAVESDDTGRLLGGHRFVEAKVVDSPFVDPWIAFRQGGALLTAPRYLYPGAPAPTQLNLGGLRQTLGLQVAPAPRVAVDARLGGQVTTGVDPDAAFYVGALGSYDATVGGSLRVFRAAEARRAGAVRAFVTGGGGAQLEPVRVVDALLDDREQTLQSLLDGDWAALALGRQRYLRGGLGFSAAQAVAPALGLQLSVGGSGGSVTHTSTTLAGDVEEVDTDLVFTGGLAMDWTPRGPVGLLVEIANRWQNQGWIQAELRERVSHRGALGAELVVRDRANLQLGLGATALLPTHGGARERLLAADLRAVYLFRPGGSEDRDGP